MPTVFTTKLDPISNPSAPAPQAADLKSTPTQNGNSAELKARSDPQQPLPTDRINFDKQLRLLRAYAAASNQGAKPASNEDVAGVVEMKPSTVSLANNFFVKCGFLIRSGREYTPAKEVLEYKLAHDWDPANAALKLAPLVDRSWFAQALRTKLDLRPMEEAEAVGDLALRANAGPEYKNQIKTLVDYLVASGIVARDGTTLSLVRRRPIDMASDIPEEKATTPKSASDVTAAQDLSHLPFGQVGSIKFAVSINVDMTQMAEWEPQRISAFFTGLAQVIASQRGGK